MSSVTQESVLGPVLFNIFISDIDDGTECTLTKFADGTNLISAVDAAEGKDAIQRELEKLRRWALVNLVRYNKARWKVLHLGQGNPRYVCKLGEELLESSPAEKNLGLFSLEKRRLQGHLIVTFQYLKGVYKHEGNQLFTPVDSDRTRGNGFIPKEGRFRLDVGEVFYQESGEVLEQAVQSLWISSPWRCLRPGWMEPWAI